MYRINEKFRMSEVLNIKSRVEVSKLLYLRNLHNFLEIAIKELSTITTGREKSDKPSTSYPYSKLSTNPKILLPFISDPKETATTESSSTAKTTSWPVTKASPPRRVPATIPKE